MRRISRRFLGAVAATGVLASVGALPATAAPQPVAIVLTASQSLAQVAVHVDAVSNAADETTSILIELFSQGGDLNADPDPLAYTFTGLTCTVSHAPTLLVWDGDCTLTNSPNGAFLLARATPSNGGGAGPTSDSNVVVVADLDGGDASSDNAGSGPADILQAVPVPSSGRCADVSDERFAWGTRLTGGWGASWAEWLGGPVCVRTLTYAGDRWQIRS